MLTGVSEKQQVFIKRLKISVNYRVTASPCGPTEASSIVILRWKSIISVIQNYEQLTFDGLPVFGSYYRVSQKNTPIKQTKMAKPGRLVNIPKGFKRVRNGRARCFFDNLGPFWNHLNTFGPFQTKINLLPHKGSHLVRKVKFF